MRIALTATAAASALLAFAPALLPAAAETPAFQRTAFERPPPAADAIILPFASPLLLAPAGGSGPYGAHQYWRVYVTSNAGHASQTAIGEIEFRGTVGGSDLTGSGTAISGGSGSDTLNLAAGAFDNSNVTAWGRSATGTCWIGYNFGTPAAVAQVALQPDSTSVYTHLPQSFKLEYSDDGSSWTTAETLTAQGWNIGVMDAYPKTPVAANTARMWRVNVSATNAGSLTVCTDLQWRASAGGADQSAVLTATDATTSGRAIFSTQNGGNEAWRAYDSIATGANGWAGNVAPQWLGYVFPAPVLVAQVAYTAYTNASTQWAPTALTVQYSNDNGATWTTAASFSSLTWTNSEQKLFAV